MVKKRVYKNAAVEPCDGGFTVELDGHAVKTPAKQRLVIASEALAVSVAQEWRAQGEEIRHETMPNTRYVCTALDRVMPQRGEVIDETVRFAETDLLCYRAEAPRELAKRQIAAWQPLLEWAGTRYDARLETTTGVIAIDQDRTVLKRLRGAVEAESDLTLTGLHIATSISGSLIVALALMEGEIDAEQASAISHIEEHWQIERWGEDEDLTERLQNLKREMSDAHQFILLSRT